MRNGLFAIPLLLLLLPACSTKSNTCTLLGCQSGATVKALVNLPPDEMLHATVVACRNGACASGTPTTLPTADGDRLLIHLSGGGITAQAFVMTHVFSPTLKGYELDTEFSIGDDALDGDMYSVTVQNGGAPAATAMGTATYALSTPNGADCPPTCHNATIDKTL